MAKKPPPKPPAKPQARSSRATTLYTHPSSIKAAAGKPGPTAKERITPPKDVMLTTASARLKKGDPEAARIMSEEAQAVKQGIIRRLPARKAGVPK
jgi:hypothetical protein